MTRFAHRKRAPAILLTLGTLAVALAAGSTAGAAGHRTAAQPLSKQRLGNWRGDLDPAQLAQLETALVLSLGLSRT